MKFRIFNIGLFARYKKEIEKKNVTGIIAGGFIFIGAFLLDFIVKLAIKPESIDWFYLFYVLLTVVGMIFTKLYAQRRTGMTNFLCGISYILVFASVFHSEFFDSSPTVIVRYALASIVLSVLILIEPFSLILGQVLGALAFCVAIYVNNHGIITGEQTSSIIIVCLLSIIIGMIVCYIRVENLVFEREIIDFAESEDGDFVSGHSDMAWSGKNKYGILSGELSSRRRVFTFVMSVSKGRLLKIRSINPFGIKQGAEWKEVRERVMAKAMDPASRMRLSRFFDPDTMMQAYRAGKRRFSAIAGFYVEETEIVWLDMECSLKAHPISGEVLATIAAEDITEERILMGVLNRIVAQNYDSVTCVERMFNRTIRFAVENGAEIRGEFQEEYEIIISKYIRESVADHDRERAIDLMRLSNIEDALSTESTYEFLLDEKDKGSGPRKKLMQYSYLDPMHNFICVIKQDVTTVIERENVAKKRLANALQERETAMNARDDFMTKMSHEMRTPMNAILGLSSLMEDEINNPKAMRDYIKKVQYSGSFLLQLINDVLDMTRMEQNKFHIDRVPYSFAEFWEAIDMMIGPMCLQKKLDFEWKSSIPGDYVVYTDPLRITQIFINLLSNAVKYTPEGGHILFECREKEREDNISRLTFTVKDDGIGMSDEFQKHLFEPFAQESKDVNSSLNGTGLGLAIVKGIVDVMGGKISVKSIQGEGTTFKVVFDLEVASEGPRVKERAEEKDLTGKKVLVVEDNDINREIAVALLEKKKIVAEVAINGQDAVEKFASHAPNYYDIILMDIRMPVMSGLTATKRIRAMEREDASTIPIIAMTANAFSKDVQASLDAGLNEHMSKPIDPKRLYEIISKYV